MRRCLSLLGGHFGFFLELKAGKKDAESGGPKKEEGFFLSWVAISKPCHGDSHTGNDLDGACGLLPSDCSQGGFSRASGNGKGDRPPPTQQLLCVSASRVRAQAGNRALECSSATLSDPEYCCCLWAQPHLRNTPGTGGQNPTSMLLPTQIQRRWQLTAPKKCLWVAEGCSPRGSCQPLDVSCPWSSSKTLAALVQPGTTRLAGTQEGAEQQLPRALLAASLDVRRQKPFAPGRNDSRSRPETHSNVQENN